MSAHSGDVEDVLDTLKSWDATYTIATTDQPRREKMAAKMKVVVAWLEDNGWVDHETCCEDNDRDREPERDESRD